MKNFFEEYWATSTLAVVSLLVVVWIVVKLVRCRRSEKLHSLSDCVDGIPLFAGLVAVAGMFTGFMSLLRAISSVHVSGIGDLKIFAAGVSEIFFNMTMVGILFFFFLGAWIFVRLVYGKFLRELGAQT